MHGRIEVLTLGADRVQAFLGKDMHELLAGGFDPLFDISVCLESSLQVVQDGQQLLHEPLGGELH
jgi:hypothetical protein